MLLGRQRECARLDALIGQVRAGHSAALAVTGEAGIGKTSLLEYAVSQAGGLLVLRARGVESEQDLPFAALADLVAPILGHLDTLPGPQRDALAGALAIGPVVPGGRFPVCAATHRLLSAAAAARPVLAVVDDGHWLDAPSAQVLEFCAHRLGQEAVGLVVAVRPDSRSPLDTVRLDAIGVAGLDDPAAMSLLAHSGRAISTAVAERLVTETGGNPLALLQLSATLTDAELSGQASLAEPLPVVDTVQRAFTLRLGKIRPAGRLLLVLAAADVTSDLVTLQRAGGLLSLDLRDLASAAEAGLVRLDDGQVSFTHPLLRSAAYHGAEPAERREAHRALADSIDPDRQPVRRAWHLAAATVGPDENVASSLAAAAQAASARNAFITASRAYQRAAELTVDPAKLVPRWLAAGQAAHLGGDLTSATRLLNRAVDLADDPCVKADAQAMLAYAVRFTGQPMRRHHELVAQADTVLPHDQARAATLLALASSVGTMIGRFDLAIETATRATYLAREAEGPPGLLSRIWLAHARVMTGDRAAARALIADVLASPAMAEPDPELHTLRIQCGQTLLCCEEYESADELLRTSVDGDRALGRLAELPYGLAVRSELLFRTGDWSQAYSDVTEAVELGGDVAAELDLSYALVCAGHTEAAMGVAETCRAHLSRAVSLARRTGVLSVTTYATAAHGLLELGLANYERAAAELSKTAALINRHGLKDPGVMQWRPDYIESLIRLGRSAEAREQLAILDAEAAATASPWATATAARCRGLVERAPERATALLEEAVDIAMASASAFELARARMCFGEALRRARKRGRARRELEHARSVFELLGAQSWAERAAAELVATGVSAPQARAPIHVRLTPQELRVALQVAEGLTNQEVAARLFLSHKTIEVHLGHIYGKLGVRSRTGLARLVSSGSLPQ
jgi:ATP/maltotriose-dependent transcriptional regulator MalT